MIARKNNKVVAAFLSGNELATDNTVSTGRELFLFGNKIAEWRKDGLYISNGGYSVYTRNGNEVKASNTTKTRLGDIPNVRISQAKSIIYLNGKEWNGDFTKIDGVPMPTISADGNIWNLGTSYKKTDGWRGYSEPINAIVGANDTGMYSDSPCPSNVRERELNAISAELAKNGIKTKQVVCESSNVFCVHVYLVPKVKDVAKGREIVKAYLDNNETRLAYLVA